MARNRHHLQSQRLTDGHNMLHMVVQNSDYRQQERPAHDLVEEDEAMASR
jgi:hypothetical protein